MKLAGGILAALVLALPAAASSPAGFGLSVLVDGMERPEYAAKGTIYVEAVRGKDYALRITNPLNVRVAVALAVDGLNTIDAKHTDSWTARKWVLAPYETIVLSGWQVSESTARKFYFTGERSSYGAFLGKTENLGVIEAVFYREKQPDRITRRWSEEQSRLSPNEKEKDERGAARDQETSSSNGRERPGELGGRLDRPEPEAPAAPGLPAPGDALARFQDQSRKSQVDSRLSEEFAATGIGSRTEHGVTAVSIDLEPRPAATVRLRYEFRPQLVRLGVLSPLPDPLGRREAAGGFGSWCPEPPGR